MSKKTKPSKTELFETVPLNQAIMTLAIPTVLSSLVMVIYNLSDTYFVGMMNDPVESAAVTLTATVMLAFNAVNNLFGVGCSSMISRALGRKDMDTVHKSSAFGFYGALGAAALFAILCTVFRTPLMHLLGASGEIWHATEQYMLWTVTLGAVPAILNVVMAYMVRSEGSAMHASIGTMSGCILNIILDPFFILPFGLNMKAAGAGMATCISNCAACLYFFFYLYKERKNTVLSIAPKDFRPEKKIVGGVLAVGVPASIQNLLNVVSMTILNNYAAGYGAVALAGMGISKRVDTIVYQVSLGVSQGVMPLVSYNYASGNRERMKKAILKTMAVSLGFVLVMTAFYQVCAPSVISVFMKDAEVVAYGSRFLRGLALALPFINIDFMGVGVFQAIGRGSYSLVFAVLRKLVLEIPIIILLNRLFPLYGLAYAQFCSEAVLAIAASILLKKIMAEKPETSA